MTDVFISYSQRAPEATRALAAELTAQRFAVWFDTSLLSNEVFWRVIMKRITDAKAVIVIWSPPALESEWVYGEAKLAHEQGKKDGRQKLLCVRTPDVDVTRIPIPFNGYNVSLVDDRAKIMETLESMGVAPDGAHGAAIADLPPEVADAERQKIEIEAAYAHIASTQDADIVEAFIATYGPTNAFYRLLAEKRLAALRPAAAAAPPRPTAAAAPAAAQAELAGAAEEVILRLDPGMHTSTIRRIALTSDAGMMATASDDKTVKLWSLPSGRLVRTLRPSIGPGNEGKVYSVAYDPAGQWVAMGGCLFKDDEFILVFDAQSGRLVHRFGPLSNVVNDLEVSHDGRLLAAGVGGANGVRVWDMHTGALVLEDKDYGRACYCVAFAEDGRLASASEDGHVRLYDSNLRLIAKEKGAGDGEPFGVAFSNGARGLFGAGEDRVAVGYYDSPRVDLHDARTLKLLGSVDVAGVTGGNLGSVAFLGKHGVRLAAGGRKSGDARLFVWNEGGRGQRVIWPAPNDTIMDLVPTPDGGVAFSAGDPAFGVIGPDGRTQLLYGPQIADLRGKRAEHFTVSADGRRLRFGLKEWSAYPVLFDLGARRLGEAPTAIADLLQAETKTLQVQGWINSTSVTLGGNPLKMKDFESARSLAIAPDAKSFVLGSDWTLRRYDAGGEELWSQAVPGSVWGVHLAQQGKLVLAAYGDGTIRWHRAEDGQELLALFIHLPKGPEGPREWILFTPDGYFEASSPAAEALIGWHVNRGPDQAADFYPVETFAAAFKRPDKIDAALDV